MPKPDFAGHRRDHHEPDPRGAADERRRHHGHGSRREQPLPPGMFAQPGKFGRMFPTLPALQVTEEQLTALGTAMKTSAPPAENPGVPAGFTYLGQFIDHDITFDPTPLKAKVVDPMALQNFRTPALDLDCLYGGGPETEPFLYERSNPALFVLGQTRVGGKEPIPGGKPNDLPRMPGTGFAVVGDPRNDENLIVAQTHLALLKFHNKVVKQLNDAGVTDPKVAFADARQTITWHYQWMVLHDFVGRIVDKKAIDHVLEHGRRFYKFDDSVTGEPFIPVEFSVAAYRLGHSMVRETYSYNRVFPNASLGLMFRFSGLSGSDVPVPSDWIIDWRRFFDVRRPNPADPNVPLNASLKLDPFVTSALHDLPNQPPELKSLPVRNLIRGLMMGLPSGQRVAAFMGIPPLSPEKIAFGPDGAVAKEQDLHRRTPLWYYILKEAEVEQGGERLGRVGSRILAEVFVGLLEGDPESFLARDPLWRPTLPGAVRDDFTMADLLNFVDDVNPIGDSP